MKTLALLLLVAACTGGGKPEKVLSDYISYRFTEKNQSKEKLLLWLDGPLLEQMQNIPEQKISEFNSDGRFTLTGFKVVKSRCTEEKCFATYTVKYETLIKGQDKKPIESEIKELAELVKTDTGWKISDVKNIKSYHNNKSPIPVYGRGR